MSGNPETYGELLQKAVDILGSRFEAGQLFTHVTQKKVYHMSFLAEKKPPERQVELLLKLCRRRREGEPLQYLLGEWEFYSLPFKVGKGVLIPRADTEILVDTALEAIRECQSPKVLDLCSGTGCVAVAISHKRPDAVVTALELSSAAMPYLLQNIDINNVKVKTVEADLKEYKHPVKLNLLVCNPPYIPNETIGTLSRELSFEPRRALDGGGDGLSFYRTITKLYYNQLLPEAHVCFEVGIGQSGKVSKIMEDAGFTDISVRDDYAGIPRVVSGKRGSV